MRQESWSATFSDLAELTDTVHSDSDGEDVEGTESAAGGGEEGGDAVR